MSADISLSCDGLSVGPSPHIHDRSLSTQAVMLYVLIALSPVVTAAIWFFGAMALSQLLLVTATCMLCERLFTWMRGRPCPLRDGSAAVTGIILALSLPATTPIPVAIVAALTAIGLGKAVFGGLGMNLFNPAMVGRAFVTISFAAAVGSGGYQAAEGLHIITQATPLSMEPGQFEHYPSLLHLFVGQHNGSLGEVSVIAALIGGLFLCLKRVAAWEIPVTLLAGMAVLTLLGQTLGAVIDPDMTVLALHLRIDQALCSGALVFGAFFIATDPVTSPISRRGRVVFALGLALLIWIIRTFSGYPEGFMFAILLMNSVVPLINRYTIPTPVGAQPLTKEAAS